MNAKTRLTLLRKLNERKKASQGFTLVELMITIAVVGILSAVALPQFLRARDAAAAGAGIGEKIGLAKECATYIASGGVGQSVCALAGGTFTATWGASVGGLRCLDQTGGGTKAVITVSSTGGLSCAIS